MELGATIQALRLGKGLTQDDFAEKLNKLTGKEFGRQTISNYENGTSSPSVQLLPYMAQIFEVSIDQLLGYKPLLQHEKWEDIIKKPPPKVLNELLVQNSSLRRIVQLHIENGQNADKIIKLLEGKLAEYQKKEQKHVGD